MPVLGTTSTVEVSTDGGTTWLKVSELTGGNVDAENADVDTTSCDDGGATSCLPGLTTYTGSIKCNRDTTTGSNAAQNALITANLAKTQPKLRIRPVVLTGEYEFSFTASIGKYQVAGSGEPGKKVEITFPFKSSGLPTYQAQS